MANIFHEALQFILSEVIDGPPGNEAYLLNPGDPGLLRQLDTIDAEAASTRRIEGETTVASHVNHLLYGLTLINRWAYGEENPWKDADWEAGWKRKIVSDDEWASLRGSLKKEFKKWQTALSRRHEYTETEARGAVGFAAHTAYHLGAIRQILASMKMNSAPA